MEHRQRLTRGTLRIAGLAIIALFLVPGLSYLLSARIFDDWDRNYASAVLKQVAPAQHAAAEVFIAQAKPSVICASTQPELEKHRAEGCQQFSNLWQLTMARSLAIGALIGGAVLLALVLLLSLLAFGNRSIQYASFIAGKQLMIWSSVAEILVQGVLLVWLSFWAPVYFFKIYIAKLIGLVAVVVGFAALAAIAGIFRGKVAPGTQQGELIREADAPSLWARIRQMAERLSTPPPRQIVAGIDDNFYVTESKLQVGAETLEGRTLYVSLPLLRRLDTSEADAVLAHELAHLSGGDTANSAKLGPALLHYDQYCAAMGSGGVTIVVWPLLALYRIMIELALARSRREREFRADRVAAGLVSPVAIAKSLVKVAAYSICRGKIQNDLFENRTQLSGALGIAAAVEGGLASYVHSPAFMERIASVHVPHPFDSHPPLSERMQAVGATMGAEDYAAVAVETPLTSWASEISTADAIEGRLWSAFDEAFAAHHERSLAYRYQPANDAELAVVLKYFPTHVLPLRKEAKVEISYAGLRFSATGELIPWGSVTALAYKSGTFGEKLIVTVNDGGRKSKKTVKLPGIGNRRGQFQAMVGAYWRRHQIMTQLQTESASPQQ